VGELKKILILGATSRIAEHLARCYASERASLFLAGRNAAQLERIGADLKTRGASLVISYPADLDDTAKHAELIDTAWRELAGVDVALLAYGSLGEQVNDQRDWVRTQRELHTNFVSAACLLGHVANRMEAQGAGTLAAISSVAGDRGRRINYIYGAAKAGLSTLLAGLRHRFAGTAVKVVDIKPGLVDTPMTAKFAKGSLWASPERVARDIRRAIDAGRGTVYTPWIWRPIMLLIRLMPEFLFDRLKI
jgi:decaprenylphospho-beta-D-erythro-pentofuranosid-2-ulose 2-reductase